MFKIFGNSVSLGLSVAGLILAGIGSAQADDNAQANLHVRLDIQQGCSIGFDSNANGGQGEINFGSFINLDTDKDDEAKLSVRCSKDSGVTYTISMNSGNSGDNTKRVLRSTTDAQREIPYDLYQDTGRTKRWGEGTDALSRKWASGQDTETVPVYARVPAQPGKALYPGTYEDTVVLTITYR